MIEIVKPSVKLLHSDNSIESMWLNMERCARLCYASEPKESNTWEDAKKFCLKHINAGHTSIGRHGSVYLAFNMEVRDDFNAYLDIEKYMFSPYCLFTIINNFIYVTTNYQFISEHFDEKFMKKYWVKSVVNINKRFTFIVTTQISTSRELNRTSPNNIMEQSTRYVNFNNKGGVICQPWWFDLFLKENENIYAHIDNDTLYITVNDKTHPWCNTHCKVTGNNIGYYDSTVEGFIRKWCVDFHFYNENIQRGMKPQDARGALPLDTATKVAYSYNLKELVEVVNKRFLGTTGKPHPNARIIAEEFKKLVIDKLPVSVKYDENEKRYITI